MKRKLYILSLGLILLCSACDKLFTDISSSDAKLQGKWQKNDEDTVYFNFQSNLFQYQKYIEKDTMLAVYGYYTMLGDTAIYLELLANNIEINNMPRTYPLDFLQWDTLHGETTDTLVQQFRIQSVINKELNLTNSSKNYLFHKF